MRHAVISNNVVTNIILVSPDISHLFSAIPIEDNLLVQPGWRYIDGNFLPPEFNYENAALEIRTKRNSLLSETDIRILSDRWAQMTPEQQTAWTNYRQALRDLPLQENFPQDVVWPVQPEN